MYFSYQFLKMRRPIIDLVLGQNALEKTTGPFFFGWTVDVDLLLARRRVAASISDGPLSRDDDSALVGVVRTREVGREVTTISFGGAAICRRDIGCGRDINSISTIFPCNGAIRAADQFGMAAFTLTVLNLSIIWA